MVASVSLYVALKILHILAMAVWFAAPLTITSDIRKTLALGKPHTQELAARVDRSVVLAMAFGVLTTVTGVLLIFQVGGFKAVSPRIHTSLLLALIALAVEMMALRPAIARLSEEGATAGKIAVFAGIGHLLKVVMLVLMLIRP